MSKFRTVEISNSEYESNNIRFITVKSKNLKGRGDICIYQPNDISIHDLPIVILLHGVYGSAWSWAFQGGAIKTVNSLIEKGQIKPMILVMPSDGLWGDGSGFLPHNGMNFEKWIIDDVPSVIKECIPNASNKSPMFIGGLSMGGFGALKIGAKYSNMFKAISAHSSITSLKQFEQFIEEPIKNFSQKDKKDEDVFETMLLNKHLLPVIRFDCGLNDPLLEHNRELSKKLHESNIFHIYEEFNGEHEWDYWAIHLADSLKFFSSLI